MWPFTKKPKPEIVKAELLEAIALADPAIFSDDELEVLILDNLKSGYFTGSPVFDEYIQNPENRAVGRPYVENEIRSQHPEDRKFWSLTMNPFLERY